MIHVTETKKWEFELPDSCRNCPMLHFVQDGNATIPFCRLKNNKDWTENTVRYSESLLWGAVKYFRDKNCPLKDGNSYVI